MNVFVEEIKNACTATVFGLAIGATAGLSGALFIEKVEIRTLAGIVGGTSGTLALIGGTQLHNKHKMSWQEFTEKLKLASNVQQGAIATSLLCAVTIPNFFRYPDNQLNLWFLASGAVVAIANRKTLEAISYTNQLAAKEFSIALGEARKEVLIQDPEIRQQIIAQQQHQQVLPQSSAMPVTIPTQAVREEYQEAQHYQSQPLPIDSTQPEISHNQIQQAQEDLLKNEILNTLESFKIKNSKWVGRIDGHTFIRCLIEPAPGVPVAAFTKRAEDLGRVLKLEQPPMIGINSGAITIDIPRPDRQFVNFSDYFPATPTPQNLDGLWVAIGVDLAGNLIEINLADSKSPHALIGGTTGGGKSALIRAILASLIWRYTPEQVRIYLCDTGQVTFTDFEFTPWVEAVVKSTNEGLNVLDRLCAEMDRRNKLFPSVKAQDIDEYNAKTGSNLPHLLFVFEEYADFTGNKETKSEVEEKLQRLSQLARKAGIHIIIATQRPSAKVLSPEIRSNCPARIALKTATTADSKIIFGSDCEDAFYLLGKGDMLYEGQRLQSLLFDLAPTLEQYQEAPKAKQIKNPFLDYFSGGVEFVADNRQRFENFRLSLPTHPGCYLVATENYAALYVGEAENIQRRWTRTGDKAHHWIPVILELIKRGEKVFVYYLVCGDRKNKERDLVELFQTKWNGKKPEIELKNLRSGEVNYDQPTVEDIANDCPIPEDFQPPAPGTITSELKETIINCKRAGWSQNRTLQELYPTIAKSSGGTYKKLVEIYQKTLKEAGLYDKPNQSE